jgi:hypothetical protein
MFLPFDDLIVPLPPPPNRRGKSDNEHEHHFYEGAVMLAYAMHLLRAEPTSEVHIHPDGEHGKQFDFRAWLARQGFVLESPTGKTPYGGSYKDLRGRIIVITPKPGLGDVVANFGERIITAECKGGIINTRHPGQVSRLYRGLCETVGLLMASPSLGRQIAVVPYTPTTLSLAKRLVPRCALAGIEIALVKERGEVIDVKPDPVEATS